MRLYCPCMQNDDGKKLYQITNSNTSKRASPCHQTPVWKQCGSMPLKKVLLVRNKKKLFIPNKPPCPKRVFAWFKMPVVHFLLLFSLFSLQNHAVGFAHPNPFLLNLCVRVCACVCACVCLRVIKYSFIKIIYKSLNSRV